MSGGGRLTVCALIATVAAACSLLPLVGEVGWIVQAALLLAAVAGTGAVARRVPVARPLTVASQVAVGLVLLTVVFAREQAVAGVLPSPEVFRRFGALLEAGVRDVGQYAPPAPATDGIRLMLVGGVLLVGLAVDVLAVTFRSAAPAGLPLLALYSVAAGLSGGGASWLGFLVAAAGYLMLLLAEGRDRLAQWGRVFGGPKARPGGPAAFGAPDGSAPAPLRTGRRIGVFALGIALVVPSVLPSLDGGLLGTGGAGEGAGGGTISAVNPLVSLKENLNQPEDREVLRYRTNAPDGSGLYLRLVSLDQFDGTSWRTSVRGVEDVPQRLPRPVGLSERTGTTEISTNVSAAGSYEQKWLPMPYPATDVRIEGRWRYEPVGRMVVGDDGQTTSGVQYSVNSLVVQPTAEQLAVAPAAPGALLREYTRVPDSLPRDVKATALQVTAGAKNDYERAVRLQDWFASKGGFSYDTTVSSGTGVTAISRFLRDKEGFCVHFSFAMAAMARTLSVPARVAVGFMPGTPSGGGTVSVSIKDAHAWPELYFEGVGWTRFEPTPSRGSIPDYALTERPDGAQPGTREPAPRPSAVPSAEPSPQDGCAPGVTGPEGCAGPVPQGAEPPADAGAALGPVLLAVAGATAALVLPLAPMLWRRRVRARRLRGGRPLEVWTEVVDTAWDHGVPPDESLTPRGTADRLVRTGPLEGPAAEAVHRIAGAVEEALYARAPRPVDGLAQDAARVRAGIVAASGRGVRLRALLAPRSAARVAWALSRRRAAVAARWGALLRRPSRQQG
ncbi:transglutaminaseTgpA domain-containing protein [Streptomyces roseolilacinus]|uniref:transglutaminaseTgpA domain-containing protein n=1 Tax=Streptomyces roseolilacinus TaxID=66904 RepID=UPI003829D500